MSDIFTEEHLISDLYQVLRSHSIVCLSVCMYVRMLVDLMVIECSMVIKPQIISHMLTIQRKTFIMGEYTCPNLETLQIMMLECFMETKIKFRMIKTFGLFLYLPVRFIHIS